MAHKYATALLLASVFAGAGAAAQQTAMAESTTHTMNLRLHVIAGHSLDKLHFVGTERVRSRDTHQVVGFDSFRGHIKANTVVYDTAFAFKHGVLLTRIHTVDEAQGTYAGHVIGGTGAFSGATGTVRASAVDQETTLLTIVYTR
jgi:hypothetical protein